VERLRGPSAAAVPLGLELEVARGVVGRLLIPGRPESDM
jgi:hypothetical protein